MVTAFGGRTTPFLQQEMEKAVISIEKISNYLNSISNQFNIRTQKIKELNSIKGQHRTNETKEVIDLLANDLIVISYEVRVETQTLDTHFLSVLALYKMILEKIKNKKESVYFRELVSIKNAIISAFEGINKLIIELDASPALTTNYINAKRESLIIFNNLIYNLNSYVKRIDRLLG